MGNIICLQMNNNEQNNPIRKTKKAKTIGTTIGNRRLLKYKSTKELLEFKSKKLNYFINIHKLKNFNKEIINRNNYDKIICLNNDFIFYYKNDELNIENMKKIENELKFSIKTDKSIDLQINSLIFELNKFLSSNKIDILGYNFCKFYFTLFYNKNLNRKSYKTREFKFISINKKEFKFGSFLKNIERYNASNFYFYYMLEYFDNFIIILKKNNKKITVNFVKTSIKSDFVNQFTFNSEIKNIKEIDGSIKLVQWLLDPLDSSYFVIFKIKN